MDSPSNESYLNKETENVSTHSNTFEEERDQHIFDQIELMIQRQYQIVVPAILFEYKPSSKTTKEFVGWDYDDLVGFFNLFGDIDLLEIYGKVVVILFKNYVDAYTSKEFLQTSSNFKETEKNNFQVRWYNQEDKVIISDVMKIKLKKYYANCKIENAKVSTGWNNTGNFVYSMPWQNQFSNFNNYSMNSKEIPPNFNAQYNYYCSMGPTSTRHEEPNSSTSFYNGARFQNNNEQYFNQDVAEMSSTSDNYLLNGKYTCKFKIQIENDYEFQVSRKLIGAKGCNMKKIIDMCSRDNNGNFIPDAIKLRLRGKGSGFKEGPCNKESNEPLHLCISSKYHCQYQKACTLVKELITNIYDEYKRFCERNGKFMPENLMIQKEEDVSSRKNPEKAMNSSLSNYNNTVC